MIFRVCGKTFDLADDKVSQFLNEDKFYNGQDIDIAHNTFECALESHLKDGYCILFEDDDVVLLGAKWNNKFKMLMFELLRKHPEGCKKLTEHENSITLKDFSKLRLE